MSVTVLHVSNDQVGVVHNLVSGLRCSLTVFANPVWFSNDQRLNSDTHNFPVGLCMYLTDNIKLLDQ